MKAIIENVTIIGGQVNEKRESKRLTVDIPSGMNGRQLEQWKKRNEAKIVEAIEASDDAEGDTCRLSGGQPVSLHIYY